MWQYSYSQQARIWESVTNRVCTHGSLLQCFKWGEYNHDRGREKIFLYSPTLLFSFFSVYVQNPPILPLLRINWCFLLRSDDRWNGDKIASPGRTTFELLQYDGKTRRQDGCHEYLGAATFGYVWNVAQVSIILAVCAGGHDGQVG